MRINLVVDARIPGLTELLERFMSDISVKIAELGGKVDAASQRTATDVASLRQKIADLQAAVDAGSASPADVQALADLEAKVDAIDPATP